MGDAEYPYEPKQPTLDEANTGLVNIIEGMRHSVDSFSSRQSCDGLNWAFESSRRIGQEISFSYGRSFFVQDGLLLGGETFEKDRGVGPKNGAKRINGVFQRFDTIETPDELVNSGRNLTVLEVCLVCADNGRRKPPPDTPVEIYYPIVNLGDDGISFPEEA